MIQAVLDPCSLVGDGKLFETLDEGERTLKDGTLVWPAEGRESSGLQSTMSIWDHDPQGPIHLSLPHAIRNRLRRP